MAKKKPFNMMADAIYEMHRKLRDMRQDFKSAGDSDKARLQIMREYADTMKAIAEKVGKSTQDWISSIKENS